MKHTHITAMVLVLLATYNLASAEYIALGANYVCVPANALPDSAYRIYTDSDILYMYAFNFDPHSLGKPSTKGSMRCWFKITKRQRDAANALLKNFNGTQKIATILPDIEKLAAQENNQNAQDAFAIIKKIQELSENQATVWHLTSYLLYKRP